MEKLKSNRKLTKNVGNHVFGLFCGVLTLNELLKTKLAPKVSRDRFLLSFLASYLLLKQFKLVSFGH